MQASLQICTKQFKDLLTFHWYWYVRSPYKTVQTHTHHNRRPPNKQIDKQGPSLQVIMQVSNFSLPTCSCMHAIRNAHNVTGVYFIKLQTRKIQYGFITHLHSLAYNQASHSLHPPPPPTQQKKRFVLTRVRHINSKSKNYSKKTPSFMMITCLRC